MEEDHRLPRGDRDGDDVHTSVSSNVDPGAGRDLLARHSGYLLGLAAELETVTDTMVRAQLAQNLLDRFRPIRDTALHTLTITYEKPPKQVAKDVGCTLSDIVMACRPRSTT